MKIRTLLTTVCVLMSVVMMADAPVGYYNKAHGLKKDQLKMAMHMIAGKAKVLGYGGGEGKTWTGFYTTDRIGESQVCDRYSNGTFNFKPTDTRWAADAVAGMNIEHSFPKSWWGGVENQSYKDLFNLMPSESTINNSKSNNPMGIVITPTKDNGCTKVGSGKVGEKNINLWEPADKWKGDFARSYFYMVTMYSHLTWTGDQALACLESNDWPTLQKWAYELYLQWAKDDPVDDIERARNDSVFNIQGNRNPFVDFPDLAEYIWGSKMDEPFVVPGATVKADELHGLFTYPVTEVLSSMYSCRADVNWCHYAPDANYELTVYTNKNGGKEVLDGFPVQTTASTYRITNLTGNTKYYYTVALRGETTEMVEDSFYISAIPPVFSVSPMGVTMTSVPGEASKMVEMKVSLAYSASKVVHVAVEAPFEVSLTGADDTWTTALDVTSKLEGVPFYVRMTSQTTDGQYKGEMIVTSEGLDSKHVMLIGNVDSNKSFYEDFETGKTANSGYAVAAGEEIQCSAAKWKVANAGFWSDSNTNSTRNVRMKAGGSLEMVTAAESGCDELSFYAGLYGSDTGLKLTVSYSVQDGTWVPVVTDLALGTWQKYSYKLNVEGAVKLKFEATGANNKRINMDDVQMSAYNKSNEVRAVKSKTPSNNKKYNTSGRPVDSNARGIVITQGKKIVKK